MGELKKEILEGQVTKITNYGAFVKLKDGKSGMVHISEISYNYINSVEEELKVGDTVKIVFLENRGDKLSFSIKRAQEAPTNKQFKRTTYIKNSNASSNGELRNYPQDNKLPLEKNCLSGSSRFEDMLNKFKQVSDEKLSSIKKAANARRGNNRKSLSGRK